MESNVIPKRILLINSFFHIEGGADTYFFNLADLLKKKGHKVIFFCMHHPQNKSSEFDRYFVSYLDLQKPMNFLQKIRTSTRLFWSFEANSKLAKLIEEEKPDIAHIHNIHHEISPSIMHILKRYKIPIVMTLHDYVLVCPLRTMFLRSKLCEKCKNRHFFNVVMNKCIRNSYLKSFIVYFSVIFHHKIIKTYEKIDLFISPSKFLIEKFREMNFKKQIIHLSHFLNIDKYKPSFNSEERSIVYLGRLQDIKGADILIKSVKNLNLTLKIIGHGPYEEALRKIVINEKMNNVVFLGFLPLDRAKDIISRSMFLVVPSLWNEVFGYSILESFALGKTVIASKVGGISELIIDGKIGITFIPRDINDLRTKIITLLNNPHLIIEMGKNARDFVTREFNSEDHYIKLLNIYNKYF